MNWTKIALGTVVGGIVYFLLGWAVWGILLTDVFVWPAGVREVVEKKPEDFGMGLMIASSLVWALFLTWTLDKIGSTTFQSGATNGAIIGGLLSLAYGLGFAAMYTFGSVNNTLIDTVASAVVNAIIGGLIGWLLGRK